MSNKFKKKWFLIQKLRGHSTPASLAEFVHLLLEPQGLIGK